MPDLTFAPLVVRLVERFEGLTQAGGPVAVVLLGFSVVALAIVALKLWQFAYLGARAPVVAALDRWRRGEVTAALAALHSQTGPVARVLRLAMAGLRQTGIDHALLREELTRVAGGELERLRAYLRTLELIGTLSPLLGLLGTVLGMIAAFQQLEQAGARVDPALLSGGIWQALLTTALGLSIAIPTVLAHTWLERRVERCGQEMEDAVTQVFTSALGALESAASAADAAPVVGGASARCAGAPG